MLLKSILNQVQLHRGFVYGSIRLLEKRRPVLEVEIRPRKNGCPGCSICGISRPGYDSLPVRRFEFVPLWGISVFFFTLCGGRIARVVESRWSFLPST
jgi:hypothetical protein